MKKPPFLSITDYASVGAVHSSAMDEEDPSPQLATPLAATGNETEVDANVDQLNHDAVESICHREGCEALSRAISSTLGSVMSEFDSRAEGASRSQDELCSTIDRFTGELDKLLEDASFSFIMQNAAKITSVRRRVSALNLVLKSIQRRLDNIDRMLSTGLPKEKLPPDIAKASSLAL